ncbi:chromosomal replication initiator protein DnaA [bacterium]|nr:chromosomal replication initiator protein DnaA [bacterium]
MNFDQASLWNQCLDYLQEVIPTTAFTSWICPLQVQQIGQTILLGAPNRIVMEELRSSYLLLIESFFKENYPDKIKALKIFIIGDESIPQPSNNKINFSSSNLLARLDSTPPDPMANELNPEFTFINFVIGKSNQLAEAAAEQVAQSPGIAYNPLFLYGGVGLGKTHLMQAIGNKIKETKPHLNVRYLHSERFVADMVKAIQSNTLDDFKTSYRTIDILMIDDIQFFAGKERSQEEFFYTFNNLVEMKQQIILTSDRFPKDLGGIADRLKSRFGSGLTVAVDPPDLETRVAILLKKGEIMKIDLTSEVAFYIAQNVRSNIRELEGALKRVIAHARFMSRAISIELTQRALKDIVAAQERLTSFSNIVQVVSDHFRISIDQLLSPSRQKRFAWPRHLAIALCRDLSSLSLLEIGRAFGGRDHTTIMHACRKIDLLRENDADVAKEYNMLIRQLSH